MCWVVQKSEVAHVVFDVVVKSVYAICLQEFGFRCDRTYFEFPSMSVTVVPDEEYQTKNEHAMDEYANERLSAPAAKPSVSRLLRALTFCTAQARCMAQTSRERDPATHGA
eukprot:1839909-Rhodomonas_salina.1